MTMFRLAALGVAGGIALPVLLTSRERSLRQEQVDAINAIRSSLPQMTKDVASNTVSATPLPATSSFLAPTLSENPLLDMKDRTNAWWNRMVLAGHSQFVDWFFEPADRRK